jgi:hypothetical protein
MHHFKLGCVQCYVFYLFNQCPFQRSDYVRIYLVIMVIEDKL